MRAKRVSSGPAAMLDVLADPGRSVARLRSRASSAIHGPAAFAQAINLGEVPTPAAFYFDLASPLAYLAAERILHVLGIAAEWQPVLARDLPEADGFDAFRCQSEQDIFREQMARRAGELGLQPLRWPEPFPFDSALAMRVATYAKSIGRTVPFAQAAFRQAFAGGRSLAEPDNVLIAAAACEMHPAAVLKAAQQRSLAERLAAATAHAARIGVTDVPAIAIGERVFVGERAPEQAVAQLGAPAR